MVRIIERVALENIFDSRKSFYGKAMVNTEGTKATLYSYDTKVCEIDIADNTVKIFRIL